MATFTDRLAFIVSLDANGAIKGFQQVGREADKNLTQAQSKLDKVSGGMMKAGAGAVAFAGTAGLALFGFAKASEDARHSELQLENTLKNMPKLAGENKQSFLDLAAAIQAKTAADGDQIVAAQAMLGTFNLTGQEIRGVTPLVVDYARKFGVDMVDAATQVGKALDGQIGALKRNGVSIDANLFKTDRYGAVTKALRDQVGGFAEEEGASFSGRMERLQNQLGDLAEGIGSGVVDAMSGLLEKTEGLVDKFNELSPETQNVIGQVATYGTVLLGAAGATSFAIGSLIKMRNNLKVGAQAVGGFVSGLKTVPGALRALSFTAAAGGALLLGNMIQKAQKDAERFATSVAGGFEDPKKQLALVRAEIDKLQSTANKGVALDFAGLSIRPFDFGEATEASNKIRALKEKAKDLELQMKLTADATQDHKQQTEQATQAASAFGIELDDETDSLEDVQKRYEDMLDAQRDAIDSQLSLNDATDSADDAVAEYEDALAALAAAKRGVTRDTEAQQRAEEELRQAHEDQIDAQLSSIDGQLGYEDALDRTSDALKDYRDKLAAAAAATGEDLPGAQEDAEDALRSAKQAMLSQASAAVKLAEDQAAMAGKTLTAEDKLRIFREELERASGQLEPGSPLQLGIATYISQLTNVVAPARTVAQVMGEDVREAQERAEDAFRNATSALVAQAKASADHRIALMLANGETVTAEDRTRIYREELAKLATDMAPGSPLRANLEGFMSALRTKTDEATDAIARLRQQLAQTPGFGTSVGVASDVFRNAGGGVTRAASGFAGTVNGPRQFLVGEGGEPEDVLIVPHSKGGIRPASAAGASVGGAAAMVAYITINAGMGTDPRSLDQAVVDALTRWSRSNGAVPVTVARAAA